ncbi:hypothetical protein AXF42_Ash015745 [Apostasia shenzhenica]|uniref:AAA+ ATPase domain-containing protein n=1 Tax=Apostasia shenzhenica TaxID=1088818 RepID=A0A2H9ZU76_9ASPA|nr:hypothetical protein AXF42_Ash015745 [Apostasia shenzhenica]
MIFSSLPNRIRDPSTIPYLWLSPYFVGEFSARSVEDDIMDSTERNSGLCKQTHSAISNVKIGNGVEGSEISKLKKFNKRGRLNKFSGYCKDSDRGSKFCRGLITSPLPRKSYGNEEQASKTDIERFQFSEKRCGFSLNWSSIHHGGGELMERAEKRLNCGVSGSKLQNGESSIHLSQCANFNSEELPLLHELSSSPARTSETIFDRLRHQAEFDFHKKARSKRSNSRVVYQSFVQKYTPGTFEDVVGQNLVVQALSNAILRRKVGLIYLFHGPHGTGKRSCAHVFAKALNCQAIKPPKPCDSCKSCISYNQRKSDFVLELRPVDKLDFERIKSFFHNGKHSSSSPTYKALIIDDCYNLSSASWNYLTNFIDQNPKPTVFIFISSITIEFLPHLITSRCQKFFFPRLRDVDIRHKLQRIARNEGLEVDRDAMRLIASRSDGSLRNAEMVLEQLSLLGQRISLPLVQELVSSCHPP